MFINRDKIILEDGINYKILSSLIKQWQSKELPRLKKLGEEYNRQMSDNIVINHAKYITDTITNFVFGKAVQYTNGNSELYVENMVLIDEDSHNNILGKHQSIYGCGFEYIFINEEDMVDLAVLSPLNTMIIYSNDIVPKPIMGVYITENLDEEGAIESYNILAYTDTYVVEYQGKEIDKCVVTRLEPHYFGRVPILECKNNEERKGDFEDLVGLIHAYEDLQTNRVFDKKQFVEKLLVITNSSLGDTLEEFEASKQILKEGGILELESSDGATASAQFISQTFNEDQVETLKDALLEDIFRMARIPNLSDEAFGNTASGISLKYKLFGTETLASEKERQFKRTLRERLAIVNNIYTLKGGKMELSDVDITMIRNIPTSKEEALSELQATEGILSLATRIARYDSEINVEEEIARLQEEKQFNMNLVSQQFGNYEYGSEEEDIEEE